MSVEMGNQVGLYLLPCPNVVAACIQFGVDGSPCFSHILLATFFASNYVDTIFCYPNDGWVPLRRDREMQFTVESLRFWFLRKAVISLTLDASSLSLSRFWKLSFKALLNFIEW